MPHGAYFLGRTQVPLSAPFKFTDRIFGGDRVDGQTIGPGSIEHCTFANVSFKKSNINSTIFNDCVFIGCYFRRAAISDCRFVGCRFFHCDFPYISIRGSDLRYSKFINCFLTYSEIQLSLPQEPNICEELCKNLAEEAAKLGHREQASLFRLREIRAREENLRAAFSGATEWYRSHYDGWRRLGAGLRFLGSVFNRWMWGYGERARVLLYNFFILGVVIFPGLFYWYREELTLRSGGDIKLLDTIYFSLSNIIPNGVESFIVPTSMTMRLCVLFESFIGLVIAGLFVSYLFRWILHR